MFNTTLFGGSRFDRQDRIASETPASGQGFNSIQFNQARFDRIEIPTPLNPLGHRVTVPTYRMILADPQEIPFFLVLARDHTTPALGLTPTVLVSSAGGAFRPAVGPVQEIGHGWYGIRPAPDDILGVAPMLLVVDPGTSGIDPCTFRIEVMPISGVVPLRVNQTRYPLTFYMTQSDDHVTPATGAIPTVSIRKTSGSFSAPVGVTSEIGHGWFMVRPDKADVDTVGPLSLAATATSVDAALEMYDVMGTTITNEIDRYTLVLLMIRTMLVNSGLFTEATCVISLDKMPFSTPSIPSAWINPGSTGFDDALESGGSRYTLLTSPVFTINVVVRRMQDVEVHDKNWLTNVARGAYPLVWKVVNLLAGKFVYSAAGDVLTTRSLRPLAIGNPYRYNQDSMLSVVPVTFTTNVEIDVTNAYPYIPNPH